MVSSAHVAQTIGPIRLAEVWQISADLFGNDRVSIDFEMNEFEIESVNGTADAIRISAPLGTQNATLEGGNGQVILDLIISEWMQMDVLQHLIQLKLLQMN